MENKDISYKYETLINPFCFVDTWFESENNKEVPVLDTVATTTEVEYRQQPAVMTSERSEIENGTHRRNKVNRSLCEVCSKEHFD
jgi:hypothetical protein